MFLCCTFFQALNRGNALSEQVGKLALDIDEYNKTKEGSPKQLTKRITEIGDVSHFTNSFQ